MNYNFTVRNKYNGKFIRYVSRFKSYLTKIDPRVLSYDDAVYAISDDLKLLSQVYYYGDQNGTIQIGNEYMLGYIEDGLNTIDFSPPKLPGSDIRSIYAMLPNSALDLEISVRDENDNFEINTVYMDSGNPEMTLYAYRFFVADVKIGDFILNGNLNLACVTHIEHSIDEENDDEHIIFYMANNDTIDYEITEPISVIRLYVEE